VSDPYGYSIHSTSPLGSHGPDNTQIAQPLVAMPSVVTPNDDSVFQYAEPQIREQPGIRKELLSMIDHPCCCELCCTLAASAIAYCTISGIKEVSSLAHYIRFLVSGVECPNSLLASSIVGCSSQNELW
jgi:hypothetical protein